MSITKGKEAIRFFEEYLSLTGLPHTGPETEGDPALIGKRVGLVNGASWIAYVVKLFWTEIFTRCTLDQRGE